MTADESDESEGEEAPEGDETPTRDETPEETAEGEPAESEPTESEMPLEEVAQESPGPSPEVPGEETEAPLADLARSLEEAEEAPGESDLFEQMDVADVDTDAVWESVTGEEAEAGGPGSGGPGGAAEEVKPAGPAEGGEHVVDKRAFCHRCVYFTEPPETACTHEGTEIVEVIDSEQFRVRNCPMVGEDGTPNFKSD